MHKYTLFRIAPMTKPITSVALMMLWEEGKFQLNDPVNSNGDASNRTGTLVSLSVRHRPRDAGG